MLYCIHVFFNEKVWKVTSACWLFSILRMRNTNTSVQCTSVHRLNLWHFLLVLVLRSAGALPLKCVIISCRTAHINESKKASGTSPNRKSDQNAVSNVLFTARGTCATYRCVLMLHGHSKPTACFIRAIGNSYCTPVCHYAYFLTDFHSGMQCSGVRCWSVQVFQQDLHSSGRGRVLSLGFPFSGSEP